MRNGDGLPIVRELEPPPDPWTAAVALERLGGLLFLDSALPHRELGSRSYVAAAPFDVVRLACGSGDSRLGADPFAGLRRALARFRASTVPGLPPFQGGAAGLLSYELGRALERIPAPRRDSFRLPDLVVGLYDWVLAFDHVEERAWIIAHGFPEPTPAAREQRARERIDAVLDLLSRDSPQPAAAAAARSAELDRELRERSFPVAGRPAVLSNFDRDGYLAAVRRAIEYIYAGDVFQVNLSQQLLCQQQLSPLELHRRLRERNPTTFAAVFEPPGEDFAVVSASPERFLRVSAEGVVESRPIKGTRPRGSFAEEDRFSRDALRESRKDRSENVMIVDLLRNDLSRVCAPGSVEVPDLFGVETYPSIHHMVSVVRGQLAPGRDALDLLAAAFPGGSITGAPKVRAMEIIAELEPDARGPYCGSLGFIGFDGAMDTSILIRTVTAARGWLRFPVGGGIVAESVPEREYRETLDKAEGILWALS